MIITIVSYLLIMIRITNYDILLVILITLQQQPTGLMY